MSGSSDRYPEELAPRDRRQLREHGVSGEEVRRHLELLRDPPAAVHLLRPCTPGDGVLTLDGPEQERLTRTFEAACREGRVTKFVPASGAATRMFRNLLELLAEEPFPDPEAIRRRAAEGEPGPVALLELQERLRDFPFADALEARAPLAGLAAPGQERRLLELLLTPEGLDLAALPKGLLPFHRYPEGSRTAFEEHLVEGVGYLADGEGRCRYHFTVPPGHGPNFEAQEAAARRRWSRELGVTFGVGYSRQDPATDTVAVDPEGAPFRLDDGSLLLRPGGHGALIYNIDRLDADLVVIKNLDLLGRLRSEDPGALETALHHLEEQLGYPRTDRWRSQSVEATRKKVEDRLDRPLRVCGVVRNEGEPGGGPFWVAGPGEAPSKQIVEAAQVTAEQRELLAASTHFNPVLIVGALRDLEGRQRDLLRHVDPRAVFVAAKTHGGRPLRALERPGLWNGAMAGWNTLFVEVPIATFAPVKTVFDLLRPKHRVAL
jgi:hypothetical protein